MPRYKAGDIVLYETFAGINIHAKVIRKTKDNEPGHPGFDFKLTERSDAEMLKRASVPVDLDNFKEEISFGYDWKIKKVIERAPRKNSKGKRRRIVRNSKK
jgi:hypothetical protein